MAANPSLLEFVICGLDKWVHLMVGADDKYASAHDLPRSFGTRWAKRVMPAVLKRLMRHASIDTTMSYYVALDSADVQQAVQQSAREG